LNFTGKQSLSTWRIALIAPIQAGEMLDPGVGCQNHRDILQDLTSASVKQLSL
jgi:hypothetical protein